MFLFKPVQNIFYFIALVIVGLGSLTYGFFYILESRMFLNEFNKSEPEVQTSLLEDEAIDDLDEVVEEVTETYKYTSTEIDEPDLQVEIEESEATAPINIDMEKNEYYSNKDIAFLDEIVLSNFVLKSKTDIKNGFYTILNYGYDSYTFNCDTSYLACSDDIVSFVENKELLSIINNYVHPFNSYKTGNIIIHSNGTSTWVDFDIERLYTDNQINIINQKVNSIISIQINESMSINNKILTIHDYIVNNTAYDTIAVESGIIINESNAYGSLIEGSAICTGYSDAMAIFLERFGVTNYKVSSSTHIWNLVYLSNDWIHLDLTWNDPVTSNNKHILLHDYYLISYSELMALDNEQHNFEVDSYIEAR